MMRASTRRLAKLLYSEARFDTLARLPLSGNELAVATVLRREMRAELLVERGHTIRRSMVREQTVVDLVELGDLAEANLERLLAIGTSRAQQHLKVIGPSSVTILLR